MVYCLLLHFVYCDYRDSLACGDKFTGVTGDEYSSMDGDSEDDGVVTYIELDLCWPWSKSLIFTNSYSLNDFIH